MNLNYLRYFRTLAKTEHYTLAADELMISQPSLSYAIRQLEEELGVYLFEKQGRGIRLTKQGKIYLEYIEKGMNLIEEGNRVLTDLGMGKSDILNIAYVSSLAPVYIPQLISLFYGQFKGVAQFACHEGVTRDLISDLKQGIYDFVFGSKIEQEHSVKFIPLFEQPLMIVLAPGHPLASQPFLTFKEIASESFILHTTSSGMRPLEDVIFSHYGKKPLIRLEAEEDRSILGFVSEGYGIGIVTDSPTVRTRSDVVLVPLIDKNFRRIIYMAYMKDRYLSPTALDFKTLVCKTANYKD